MVQRPPIASTAARTVRRAAAILWGCLPCVGLLPANAPAQTVPLWEAGIGVGTLYLNDYRGASHTSAYALPFPYFIYHGRIFKVNRSGIHGQVFGSRRVLLDISLAGGVPVSSRSNPVRQGMPNLAPTVELGPSLDTRLWAAADGRSSVWLRVPARAVFAVDLSRFAHRGWVLSPFAEYRVHRTGGRHPWWLSIATGPIFADEAYHDYYYRVRPAYATATRPAYNPGGGYSGSRVTINFQQRFSNFWFGVFARYDNLSGAAFAASPLVDTKSYFAVGLGITWIFAESGTLVSVP